MLKYYFSFFLKLFKYIYINSSENFSSPNSLAIWGGYQFGYQSSWTYAGIAPELSLDSSFLILSIS
jgi:hypothetical protein